MPQVKSPKMVVLVLGNGYGPLLSLTSDPLAGRSYHHSLRECPVCHRGQMITVNSMAVLCFPPVSPTQRTNEIGVRMALGASSGEILLSFGKRGPALTLTGLAIGLGLAAIAARSMTNLLCYKIAVIPPHLGMPCAGSLVFGTLSLTPGRWTEHRLENGWAETHLYRAHATVYKGVC